MRLSNLKIKFYFTLLGMILLAAACVRTGVTRMPTASPETAIMGKGHASEDALARLLLSRNPSLSRNYAAEISQTYIQEAGKEGISHDVAFAQMLLETGALKFGNQVDASQHNFCGLGALDGGAKGASFPDLRTGVRAHIQHLKAYASQDRLNAPLVDPRFKYVRRGSAPTLSGLAGTWASDRKYAEKISGIMNKLYEKP